MEMVRSLGLRNLITKVTKKKNGSKTMKMELNMNYIEFLLKDKSMKDSNIRMFA
jgi:hypothetical protein